MEHAAHHRFFTIIDNRLQRTTFAGARAYAVLVAVSLTLPFAVALSAENPTFKIPPVKIPFTVKDQQAYITASALISMTTNAGDLDIFKLQLTADLAGLQENMTGLLASQLDKDDHCGDRIAIQQATLAPASPASIAIVQLHYERWACVKAFGKQQAKRVVAGNATIPVKLTPGVEENNTELRLTPEVGEIQADGSLGELLRSGAVGTMIRERIRTAILNAMQKGTNLSATLPPAAQAYATIENAEFRDAGSGRLLVELDGQVRVPKDKVQALTKEVKDRIAAGR
ncbi:MAG: hypothetical protein WA715_26955 [Candidatus Acidiferrum sp.]